MTELKYDNTRHQWEAFEAHYSARSTGRRLYTSAIYSTRAEAASEVFVACPNAQSCSSWRAHSLDGGTWFAASDMETHRRGLRN